MIVPREGDSRWTGVFVCVEEKTKSYNWMSNISPYCIVYNIQYNRMAMDDVLLLLSIAVLNINYVENCLS